MDSATTIRVAPVTPTLADGVRALQVAPSQAAYVGDPAFNLANTLQDRYGEAMAVLAGDEVVGFYRLDFSPCAITGTRHPVPSVGIRFAGLHCWPCIAEIAPRWRRTARPVSSTPADGWVAAAQAPST